MWEEGEEGEEVGGCTRVCVCVRERERERKTERERERDGESRGKKKNGNAQIASPQTVRSKHAARG
jgi:hypothetical protein